MSNFGSRVGCGWKNCRETFLSVLDMNAHVQLAHLQYSIQMNVQQFNRPDEQFQPAPPPINYPVLEDIKPIVPRVMGSVITLEGDAERGDSRIHNDISSTSAADITEVVTIGAKSAERIRQRVRVSKYWIYDRTMKNYQCIEPDCPEVNDCSMKAVKHWQTKHNKKLSGVKCARRGCKKRFPTQKLAEAHFQEIHMNCRRIILNDAPGAEEPGPKSEIDEESLLGGPGLVVDPVDNQGEEVVNEKEKNNNDDVLPDHDHTY